MNLTLAFEPLLPMWGLAFAIALSLAAVILAVIKRGHGTVIRIAAIALVLAAVFNPQIRQEDREPLQSVVAVVVDETGSQRSAGRDSEAREVGKAVTTALGSVEGIETRVVTVEDFGIDSDGTALFTALAEQLSDVPSERIAGAVMVTDGIIHDIPDPESLGFDAPVHALITGVPGETDRRLVVTQAPRFGIVGQEQPITFQVVDERAGAEGNETLPTRPVTVRVTRGGETVAIETIATGEDATIPVEITHGGESVITIEADPLEGEITDLNNRVVLAVQGIRENLRVLLVSGEPHSGERTWRNLLKSDASVDLVHFTILRPPEKQDGTPINQLSLIAFPTRELFSERIEDFDLIIFDRYQRRGVLPIAYFENIAEYVRNGGAVLVASGPDYASSRSLFRTPIMTILPAEPTGRIIEEPYRAVLSDVGARHPVTRDLPGSAVEPPSWGRWFRLIDATAPQGDVLMEGPDERPLLVLNRESEGRVALLLSDHAWLWARGLEGGGPHIPLLRRLAHWLMAEPDLEEERLLIRQRGDQLIVERRSMGENPPPATLFFPDGESATADLVETDPGIFEAVFDARGLGLYRAENGDRTALTNIGPLNPREYETVISSPNALQPFAEAINGSVKRISETGVPRIVAVRDDAIRTHGNGWIGVNRPDAYVVRGVASFPLLGGLLGLALLLGILGTAWYREGR